MRAEVTTLANGLIVAVEQVAAVQSSAFSIILPDGAADDPIGSCGEAALISEMLLRGAGGRDAREFSDECDRIGLERHVDNCDETTSISGAVLTRNLPRSLELARDLWFAPRLDEADLDAARELCRNDILAIEDSPQDLMYEELRCRSNPVPFNRPSRGIESEVMSVSIDSVRRRAANRGTNGAIICLAGNIDNREGIALIERVFAGSPVGAGYPAARKGGLFTGTAKVEKPGLSQVQIGMASSALPPESEDYPLLRIALGALSGGMSGRLFVEVREKRGLVYSVKAFYGARRGEGQFYVAAGTTPERAEETISVIDAELERIAEGIDAPELEKVLIKTKSTVVMGMESPRARAGSMANDLFHRGLVRSPSEVIATYEGVTPARINAWLRTRPFSERYLLTLEPAKALAAGSTR